MPKSTPKLNLTDNEHQNRSVNVNSGFLLVLAAPLLLMDQSD